MQSTKLSDGQITSDLQNHVSSLEIKNISLFQNRKLGYIYRHPVLLRGALANVTTLGGSRWTLMCLDERHHARRSLLAETGEAYGKDVWS